MHYEQKSTLNRNITALGTRPAAPPTRHERPRGAVRVCCVSLFRQSPGRAQPVAIDLAIFTTVGLMVSFVPGRVPVFSVPGLMRAQYVLSNVELETVWFVAVHFGSGIQSSSVFGSLYLPMLFRTLLTFLIVVDLA